MKRIVATAIVVSLLAISCGGSNGVASGTCLAGDPDCADGADAGNAGPLPDAISLNNATDPSAPVVVTMGGFFFSDGTVSQLCSALAESVPPQCASVVTDIEAPDLDVILGHVAESFGNPDDAKVNVEQGIYWTDDWINLTGTLQANRLVVE